MEGIDLDLNTVFKLGICFIKEKEGSKAFKLSYADRQHLLALCKQANSGPYRPEIAGAEVGLFDVVGSERRKRWRALGELSQEDAKLSFISTIERTSALFRPYVEAHQRDLAAEAAASEKTEESCPQPAFEKRADIIETEGAKNMEQLPAPPPVLNQNQEAVHESSNFANTFQSKRSRHEAQIRAALNLQTATQFRHYAMEQHPIDPVKQDDLIKQLQEQHFQQYMIQIYQQQILNQQKDGKLQTVQRDCVEDKKMLIKETSINSSENCHSNGQPLTNGRHEEMKEDGTEDELLIVHNSIDHTIGSSSVSVVEQADDVSKLQMSAQVSRSLELASVWSRKDIADFKKSLSMDRDAHIQVGSGEMLTVRVPTHDEGTCIFWEFATDNFDIGFGVYFEWGVTTSNKVTLNFSESNDDDKSDVTTTTSDRVHEGVVESGEQSRAMETNGNNTNISIDEIIPVCRRDSHVHVFCGSHQYPGHGVYLLKFDNSFSLWRSKALYYRVYYTR